MNPDLTLIVQAKAHLIQQEEAIVLFWSLVTACLFGLGAALSFRAYRKADDYYSPWDVAAMAFGLVSWIALMASVCAGLRHQTAHITAAKSILSHEFISVLGK